MELDKPHFFRWLLDQRPFIKGCEIHMPSIESKDNIVYIVLILEDDTKIATWTVTWNDQLSIIKACEEAFMEEDMELYFKLPKAL